ncbi:hypothetical protein IAU60_000011 [Kwoniella sp. DSM 27419]
MDVSQELANYAAANSTSVLDRPNPVVSDLGLLAAFDNTPVDAEAYAGQLDQHLLALTLTSTQALIASLFTLPTTPSTSGPITKLPPPTTLLPREKPLPKPKPLTKWERFAKAKGISHKTKERDVWDEERQEWVARWGKGGKNKDKEEQWLHEDPAKTARADRKARTAKNLKQQQANIAAAAASALRDGPSSKASSSAPLTQEGKKANREKRKNELERSMLISKTSTASLGRFDEKIQGEPKVKGVKRKFEPAVATDFSGEKDTAMGVLKRIESGVGKAKKTKKGGEGEDGGVNVRKAVRFQSKQDKKAGLPGGGATFKRGGGGKRK